MDYLTFISDGLDFDPLGQAADSWIGSHTGSGKIRLVGASVSGSRGPTTVPEPKL
jgi:hypothetical protein